MKRATSARSCVVCVIGQGLEKNFTILHALDAVVEDGENAAIRLGADEATEALLQRENRFRNLKFGERVAAVFLEARARARPRWDRWAPRTAACR